MWPPRAGPQRLLPVYTQGQSAHVRQDPGCPPEPFPRPRPLPRRARPRGALGAWDVVGGHPKGPDSPSGAHPGLCSLGGGGWRAGSEEDTPLVPRLGLKDPLSFLPSRMLKLGLLPRSAGRGRWGGGASLVLRLERKMRAWRRRNLNLYFYIETNED